jgi:hypothetical protein
VAIASIVAIVLATPTLANRRHELPGDHTRLQAQLKTATGPMVRTAARFHRHDRAGGQLRQPCRERLAPQLTTQQYTAVAIQHTNGKDELCEIHTDGCSIHTETSPLF